MDANDVTNYKQVFYVTLRPFIEFLEIQKDKMTRENWMQAVKRFQIRITVNPEQYLGRELPSSAQVKEIVNEIFDEFIRENIEEPVDNLFVY